MIKTVEVLKNYWLTTALICKLTGISNTSMRLLYGGIKQMSPSMKKEMTDKITKFLDDLRETLDD